MQSSLVILRPCFNKDVMRVEGTLTALQRLIKIEKSLGNK